MLLNALYRSDQGVKYYVLGTIGKGYSVAIQQSLIHEDPSTGTPGMHMCSSYITSNLVQEYLLQISIDRPHPFFIQYMYHVIIIYWVVPMHILCSLGNSQRSVYTLLIQ